MVHRLAVVEIETGETVRVVDVSGKTARQAERILFGMLLQADTDKFVIEEIKD